tara:strand:- start:403 stop:1635 length:1233 start_codon:yes stop_codon:yes gene_type:complete
MLEYNEWLDTLPTPKGILKKTQENSRKSLIEMGMPNNSKESWRFTNMKIFKKIFSLPFVQSEEIKEGIKFPKAPNNVIRIITNQEATDSYKLNFCSGITLMTEKEILEKLKNSSLDKESVSDWPYAINEACNQKVLGINIEGKNNPPLEIFIPGHENSLSATRILIHLKEESELEMLQVMVGEEKSANSNLIEIDLAKNSKLKHGLIANGKLTSILLSQLIINQSERSIYELNSIQHGWDLSRLEPKICQKEGAANTIIRGLQVSKGNEQLSTHSEVTFKGPDGTLDQLQKSVISQKSHCIFNGAINVPQVAQRTNASQISRNLLMSNRGKIDTKPELQIIADDVRCAHGATVSQLQENEVFYLRSRGISYSQATSLLVEGYCKEIIDKLPIKIDDWNLLEEIVKDLKND